MAERSRAKPAAQRRKVIRKSRRTARRSPASPSRPGLLDTLESHPLLAIGAVLLAGAAVATALTRPDPRRLAQSLSPYLNSVSPYVSSMAAPLLAAAMPPPRHWWEDWLPGARRTWRDDIADQAQARWQDAQAAMPSRRWWDNQLDLLRNAVPKLLPRT